MTVRGFFVGAALLVCALAAHGRQLPEASAQLDADGRWVNGVTESWWPDDGITSADASAAAARWKEIGDDLTREDSRGWSGDYFRGGETHGTYMRWSPRAGFVIASVDKCRAAVMSLVYGRVEATPTLVQFFPEFEKFSAHAHGGAGEHRHASTPRAVIRYVPVEWRGERLLLAESEVGNFGDYVAGLGEYNGRGSLLLLEIAEFFTRADARSVESAEANARASHAPPVVPAGYEKFLKKPVDAAVKAVGRRGVERNYTVELTNGSMEYPRASVTRVTISAGKAQGVKDRMAFRVVEPDEDELLIVLRAGKNESEAIVVRYLDEHGEETYFDSSENREKKHSKIAAGWKLTTNPFPPPRT